MRFGWAAGDEVYGRCGALRKDHEDNEEAYAYFVPRSFVVELPSGRRARADELLDLARGGFEVRACGPGVNGPRWYEWAMIATASEEHFLLIRRPEGTPEPGPGPGGSRVDLPAGTGFMYCHVPKRSPIAPTLANLVLMVGRRWPVEETIGVAKGPIGWDQDQFRTYTAVQRHAALSAMTMLKAAMVRRRAEERTRTPLEADPAVVVDPAPTPGICLPAPWPAPMNPSESEEDCLISLGDAAVPHHPDEECPPDLGHIRLSLAEILRLINIARSHITHAGKQFLLRWSAWRRRHQAIARWHHQRARLQTNPAQP
jgi:hypothetical protein